MRHIVEVRNIFGIFLTLTYNNLGSLDVKDANSRSLVHFFDIHADLEEHISDQFKLVVNRSDFGHLGFFIFYKDVSRSFLVELAVPRRLLVAFDFILRYYLLLGLV